MTTAIYRGMNRQELDRAYSNTGRLADFPGLMRDFRARSAAFHAAQDCRRDRRYGPGARQTYDWFAGGRADAPAFVFIHGGYWQSCVKEDFAFCAAGPLARGHDVILAEYTLAPQASMTQIVAEIGQLLDHLAAQGVGRLCLAGHSAGGHLAAMHRGHPAVGSVLAISGLFDLEPIGLGQLNDKLQLTAAEIAACSPQRNIAAGAPMLVAVGAEELPELIRQSDDYAAACRQVGERAVLLHVPGCDHFQVLDDLADPAGVQLTALAALDGRR
ncbi:alpha/beta hydrolase [Paracoccus sp. pheM1]|uniref:alpha/beta hydrolase n=1 Tax=Paracoccus sp. pheM1 TaxID=2831675 RepID=UPI001BDB6E01|nr:alpha/beta hydrolase [Paracoccus sp. pheM1]MBT0782553.1 alpha/beta hydrolase [Paracoccus sp. pheM1]